MEQQAERPGEAVRPHRLVVIAHAPHLGRFADLLKHLLARHAGGDAREVRFVEHVLPTLQAALGVELQQVGLLADRVQQAPRASGARCSTS
jgi:hypothetical protein